MRGVVLVLMLAGCGRIGFDALPGSGDGGGDGATDDGDLTLPTSITYVKASNTRAAAWFGSQVALSADGRTMAIGSFQENSNGIGINGPQDDAGAPDTGAAYVYVRVGDGWMFEAYVKASNSEPGDRFGKAVALSADGNTLAISANREDSSSSGIGGVQATNGAPDSGAVYVFTRTGSTWTQQEYMKSSNSDSSDSFGYALALSDDGNTLAVSAFNEDGSTSGVGVTGTEDGTMDSGAVYMFTRSGVTWTQQAYIKASNTGAGDRFGESVALSASGDVLAVGAPLERSATITNPSDDSLVEAGAAYVYTRTGTTWSFDTYLKSAAPDAYDQFGWSVALSAAGDVLAIGARLEQGGATGIDGDQLDDTIDDAGAVFVFERGASWQQTTYIKASNTGQADYFGESVSLSADGTQLVVAAPFEDSKGTGIEGVQDDDSSMDAGAAYLYRRAGGTWSQAAYLKATNSAAGDSLSFAVISRDGSTIAMAAGNEDSAATGIDGDQLDDSAPGAGAVYVLR